jgi:hypothetical protein
MTITLGLNLVGTKFVSQRHVNPVVWIVKYYHRCNGWVCEEQQFHTTCEFSTEEILAWKVD